MKQVKNIGVLIAIITVIFTLEIFAQEINEKSAENSDEIIRLQESVDKNFNDKNFDAAISDIEQLIRLDSSNEEYFELKSMLYFIRGANYFIEGNYESALLDLNVSIQTNEKNLDALETRAKTYLFKGDADKAFADANAALAIATQRSHSRAILSGVYFYREDFNKSIEEANIALKTDADDMLALEYRGASYSALEKYALAIKDLDRVIGQQPENINALTHRMVSYGNLENWKATRNDANTILKIQEDSASAYMLRAVANSVLQENYELIISDINRGEKLDSELMNSDTFYLRANAYRKLGRIAEAERDEKKSEELRLKEKEDNEQ